MDRLLSTIQKIQDTQAAIRKIGGGLTTSSRRETVQLTLASLYKMLGNLEGEFSRLTNQEYMDVCEYRFFGSEPDRRPALSSFTKALSDFQESFTVVLDAIKTSGRKST